jgi:hypothetical protein
MDRASVTSGYAPALFRTGRERDNRHMGDPVIQERSVGPIARLCRAVKATFRPAAFEPDQLLPSTGTPIPRRHQDALAVLNAARGAVQRGWVQNAWYVLHGPDGRRQTLGPTCLVRLDHTQVAQVCIVGAVLHAAWQQSPRPEHANPAIDALWCTLYGTGEPVGPVCAPPVRNARVRDLTRWNDEPHRTKEEVLHLLERTATRIVDAA